MWLMRNGMRRLGGNIVFAIEDALVVEKILSVEEALLVCNVQVVRSRK